MKLLHSLILTSVLSCASLVASEYKVDTVHSDIGFSAKHMMISHVKGNFKKFTGTFSLDEKSKQFSSLKGTVDVASISTQNKMRDDDLRSGNFFDVAKYPQMSLKLIKQMGDKAIVALTIKDVTKEIEMELEDISGPIKDPWGNIRSAFAMHGKIDRKDFHMNFNKVLETGGLLVGDTVKIDLTIEGIKNK